MRKLSRIIISVLLAACGVAVVWFGFSISPGMTGWQFLTVFVPTLLIAAVFFVISWQVAAGQRVRDVIDFIMSIVWGVLAVEPQRRTG